jgi:type III restriction enzyme
VTLETEGQMLHRVMPDLMGMKNIMAIDDEAHHCYRARPDTEEEEGLTGDEKKEAEKNNEAARLSVTGLEAVSRQLGLNRVVDLSATPFFARFGLHRRHALSWTMSDFSLMDAIECGIVKLPRVPVADNIPGDEMPVYRNLWNHIGKRMPKKGRGKDKTLDPLSLPVKSRTALDALYGHYRKTFDLWRQESISVPPCFIIVCNNTATSKLVYDYIAGFQRANDDGTTSLENGRLELFRNFDEFGNPLARRTRCLSTANNLNRAVRWTTTFGRWLPTRSNVSAVSIIERTGDVHQAENITDQELLREVMNTVGKPGRLGAEIRCVVSVSMLTEGWDANTVTHVLGVRAFGTQLLCEQVIGRALRRQSYELNDDGLFNVEYADVLGIPFDFTARPVVAPPQPQRNPPRPRRAPRPRRTGDSLPARGRLSGGTARRTVDRSLPRGFDLESYARSGWPVGHAQRRHHWRGDRLELAASGRCAPRRCSIT